MKIIITEEQEKQLFYDRFKSSQSIRYKVVNMLAKRGYVFHGSEQSFDSFDADKIKGGTRGVYGFGAYFTDESYKCEEYGTNFIILNIKPFKLLDVEEPISTLRKEIEYLQSFDSEINRLEDALYDVVNEREYVMIQKEIDRLKMESERYDKDMVRYLSYFLSKSPSMTIDNARKSILSKTIEDKSKDFSKLFLSIGYDGFVYENQYIIFNFDKLNKNIVKDKESLIASCFSE